MQAFGNMKSPGRVAVGSTNPSKVEAVRAVLSQLTPSAEVVGVDVASGVPAQPVGLAETRKGAQNRAAAALQAAGADWGVGLEGGVEFDADGCWVINVAAVVTRDGQTAHTQGLRTPLPSGVVARLQDGLELGMAMDELVGRTGTARHEGAVGILTNGVNTRRQMWEMTFASALPSLLHPQLYTASNTAAPAITRDFTVATFVAHEGKVLLLWHRKLQMYLPPGGHIDPHELPDEAAVREVLEETGLEVELTSRPAFTDVEGPLPLARPEAIQLEDISPGHQHIDLVYYARVKPGCPATIRPNLAETSGAAWYGPEELAKLPLTEEIAAWSARVLAAAQA